MNPSSQLGFESLPALSFGRRFPNFNIHIGGDLASGRNGVRLYIHEYNRLQPDIGR